MFDYGNLHPQTLIHPHTVIMHELIMHTSVLSQVSCGVLYQLVQDKKAWKTQDAQAISFWRQERAELRLFA